MFVEVYVISQSDYSLLSKNVEDNRQAKRRHKFQEIHEISFSIKRLCRSFVRWNVAYIGVKLEIV